jgi:hypothetical protein
MSYELYRRNVQVQITHANADAPALLSRGGEVLSIPKNPFDETLKIDFNIATQGHSQSDVSYIELYNLNDKTQSFIKDKQSKVKLLVGYGKNIAIVFDGEITKVMTTRKNGNMVTKIELSLNTDLITSAHFSRTYAGLISIKTIIQDALPTFNLPYQNLEVVPDIQIYNFTFDGRTKDLLDSLLKPAKVNWYMDKNIVYFSLIGKPVSEDVFVITPENGLIDYPVKTDTGVNVNILYNPQVALGSHMELKLDNKTTTLDGRRTNLFIQELNGKYKVVSAYHKGSSYDGDMITTLECHAGE